MVTVLKRPVVWLLALVLACTGMLYGKPEFAAAAAPSPGTVKDTVEATVLWDGTHVHEGGITRPATFVTKDHGFPIGDESENDRVVTSRDVVAYQVTVTVRPGPERTLRLTMVNSDSLGALELDDISNINLRASGLTTTIDNGTVVIKVPEGLAARVESTLLVHAKDTQGLAIRDNQLKFILTGEPDPATGDQYRSEAETDPITVVSVPMADLTLDSSLIQYNQKHQQGRFIITPRALRPVGYSDYGLSAGGTWITDIDVSSFPKDTRWWFDGSEVFPNSQGIIEKLSGTGPQALTYVISQNELPTDSNPYKQFSAHLIVSSDSFATGDLKNPSDPGNGEAAEFDTAKYEINGVLAGATSGQYYPNNNYSAHVWTFTPERDPESLWEYDIYAPREDGETIFSAGNRFWSEPSWWSDGRLVGDSDDPNTSIRPSSFLVTTDTQVRHSVTLNPSQLSSTKNIVFTHELLSASNDQQPDWAYDPTLPVVVFVGEQEVLRSKYNVAFKVGSQWVPADQAPLGATASRLTFTEDAFPVGSEAQFVEIHWPGNTRSDYGSSAEANIVLPAKVSAVIPGTEPREDARNVVLTFPTEPTINVDVYPTTDATILDSGHVRTSWEVATGVTNLNTASGNVGTITLHLPKVLDPRPEGRFVLNGSDWVQTSDWQDGSEFTATFENSSKVQTLNNDDWQFPPLAFTVDTVPYPNNDADPTNDKENPLTAEITAEFALAYASIDDSEPVDSVEPPATDSYTLAIPTSAGISAQIVAETKQTEINQELRWNAAINLGHLSPEQSWSQEFKLPRNGDSNEYFQRINELNDQNISIDPNSGHDESNLFPGIGRSQFQGEYTVSTLEISGHSAGAKVTFKFITQDSEEVTKEFTIPQDGIIQVPRIEDATPISFLISGSGNSSDYQNTVIWVTIGITPENSVANDDYVMWLGDTNSDLLEKPIIAWPAVTSIVDSSISGVIYQDQNENAHFDIIDGRYPPRHERLYSGVTVILERWEQVEGGQGTAWQKVAETTAGSDSTKPGYFQFNGLTSGRYRVSLPKIQQSNGKLESGEGELDATALNRFNVSEPTRQTQAGPFLFAESSSTAEYDLAKNEDFTRMDFGYVVNRPDLTLDKSEAVVTDSDEISTVSWDVTVTNTGETPLEHLTLHDRTSTEVADLTATLGSTGVTAFTGRPVAVTGRLDHGLGIATTDGFWLMGRPWNPFNDKDKEVSYVKVPEIIGTPVAVAGNYPVPQQQRGEHSGITMISTDREVWVVNAGFSDWNAEDPSLSYSLKKLEDIPGAPLMITGGEANGVGHCFGVAFESPNETTNYWVVDASGYSSGDEFDPSRFELQVHKIEGITGRPLAIDGLNPCLEGSVVATTDGLWHVVPERQGALAFSAHKIPDIPGDIVEAKVASYGSDSPTLIVTEDGAWVIDVPTYGADEGTEPTVTELTGVTGNPIAVSYSTDSIDFDYSNDKAILNSGVIATSDGFWLLHRNRTLTKVEGLIGTPLFAGGSIEQSASSSHSRPGGVLATTAGVWLFDNEGNVNKSRAITGRPTAFYGYRYPRGDVAAIGTTDGFWEIDREGRVTQINNITGTQSMAMSNAVVGYGGDSGSSVLTSTGLWVVRDGVATRYGYADTTSTETLEPVQPPLNSATEESWAYREYELPKLLPGEKLTITLSGTAIRDKSDYTVENQAWVTSDLTPRAGIEKANPEIRVTGDGEEPGTPATPPQISAEQYNIYREGVYEGSPDVEATDTVGLNFGSPIKDQRGIDDLADQTPALIHGSATSPGLTGTLSGMAWYDSNNNGLRDDGTESGAANIPVKILDPTTHATLAMAVTNDHGEWTVNRLPEGMIVNVSYEIVGHDHDGKHWTPAVAGATLSATNDSDTDPYGYARGEERGITVGSLGRADLGLRVLDYGAEIQKGLEFGREELVVRGSEDLTENLEMPLPADAIVNNTLDESRWSSNTAQIPDSDDSDRTVSYKVEFSNSGNEPLTNLTLKDETLVGNLAQLGKFWLVPHAGSGVKELALTADGTLVSADSGNAPVVMNQGDRVIGSVGTYFTLGNEEHINKLTLTADVLSGGTRIETLEASDELSVKYERSEPRQLVFTKIDASTLNSQSPTPLSNASFRVEATTLTDLPEGSSSPQVEYERVGTVSTDSSGHASIKLDPGVYRITEVNAPGGYVLPQGSWFIKIGYDANGSPQLEIRATSEQPYAEGQAGAQGSDTYGTITFTNVKSFTPPVTGGQALFVIAGGLGLLIAGAAAAGTLRRKQATASA